MNKLESWGLSMYGGYYANLWINGKYTGIHADTYKQLKEELDKFGLNPTNNKRWDN